MSSTVLITTATCPPEGMPFLAMTNVATRMITAKAAVYFWAASEIEKIVIADATGTTLLNNDELSLLKQMNVDVEQISYNQNKETIIQKGKGYGEGELIDFALSESVLLKRETNFFKCTGKVYCRNFTKIQQLVKEQHVSNIFWRYFDEGDGRKPWADMRFFYAEKSFAKDHLIPAYLRSDDATAAAEYYCFLLFQEKLASAKAFRPLLSGFAGGTNKRYFDEGLGFLDANFPCWFELEKR